MITTLAVIEQTDDADYVQKQEEAVNEVLSQYGLKAGGGVQIQRIEGVRHRPYAVHQQAGQWARTHW